MSIPIPPIKLPARLPALPKKLPSSPSANPVGTVPLPKTSMNRPEMPGKMPGGGPAKLPDIQATTGARPTPGTPGAPKLSVKAKDATKHVAGQVGQDAGVSVKDKAKSAATDVAKEAIKGAATGAAGGLVGAAAGAAKGAGVALLKNKHSRNAILLVIALNIIVIPAVIIGLVTSLSMTATSSVAETDSRSSVKAVTDTGKDEGYIVDAQDTVKGTDIPWEIAAAALAQSENPIDAKALEANLELQDPGAKYRDMNAGRTYASSTASRTIGTGGLADSAAKVKSVWVPALAATLNIADAAASSVYDQALSWRLGQSLGSCGVDLSVGTDTSGSTVQLNPAQLVIAQTIIGIAKSGFTTESDQRQASIIGIATGMQESTLTALHRGDLDSLGVFQQRPSWGTVDQREDPAYSAGAFFKRLRVVPNWQSMAVTVAAQTVQVSAFPQAYAKWETLARSTVAAQFPTVVAVTIPAAVGYPGAAPGDPAGATPTGNSACVMGNGAAVLPVSQYIVASNFGPRAAPCDGCSSFHLGLDFANGSCADGTKPGEPVMAVMDGTVVYAKVLWGDSGNTIEIDHGNGVMTQYLHLYTDTMKVAAGDKVVAGQVIANMGSTGHSTGCHLHFSTLVNGKQTDPRIVMAPLGVIFKPLS